MNRGQLPTNSYLTVTGVHSTMHLMHPNYWQITIMCMHRYNVVPHIHVRVRKMESLLNDN